MNTHAGKPPTTLPFQRSHSSEPLTEAEWSKREAWFRQLLEASNDGFWEWNIPTGETVFSGRWAEMLGYGPNEIKPSVESWEKLVHPDELPQVMEVLQRHLRGETEHYEAEHRLKAKSGEWRWIIDRGRVLERDADGRPLRAAGAHIDVHDRKQHELEKEEISKSRLEILGVVSHELKNPLHALLLSIDLERRMIDQNLLPATIAPVLEGMRKAVCRMQRLVSDLLDVTRLEADQLPLQLSEVTALELCNEALAIATPRAEEKHIQVYFEAPPGASHTLLRVDPLRITQVLSNLLENAIKFSPEGAELWLRASLAPAGSVTFEVEDQGPGIPLEDQPKIFDRFWQARKDAYKGTGLGLFIAQGILRSHHGRIQVETRSVGGSRFWFSLPLLRSDQKGQSPRDDQVA